MKKIFYTLFCLCLFALGKAQQFTNGTVFDYNVGDTLVMQNITFDNQYPNGGPPMYRYRIFKTKTLSANQNTITYTYDEIQIKIIPPMSSQTSFTSGSFSVTDLTVSVVTAS